MKKEILNYKNQSTNDVLLELSAINQKNIKTFLDYCRISASESSIIKISNKIILIADTFEKPLDKLTLNDIHNFLILLNKAIATKNDIKKILKRFLKWKYKNWSSKFNQLMDIRLNTRQEKRDLCKNDLLTSGEMHLIFNSIDSLKYKAILLLMQETANRPEEIIKLKWKDINFSSQEIRLNSAKTGETRTIPINQSIQHLKRYKMECFYEAPGNNDYVFPSPNNKNKHLKTQSLNEFLRQLENKIKFKKHLYPYLWRHSILSKMIKTLSPKVYEMYAGHSLSTGMKTYAHLDTDDLKDELFNKVYAMKEITKEENEEIKCLKENNKRLDTRLQEHEKILRQIQKFDSVAVNLFKDKFVQEAMIKAMLEKGIGKELVEMID